LAARRLLIVMVVLLGLSTLAAALVPQRTLNGGGTGSTTTTTSTPTTTSTTTPAPLSVEVPITVGPKKRPLVSADVGDQFTLLVTSTEPREISIPEFGLSAFAAPNAPARFELLTQTPGRFGILFASSDRVAADLEVLTAKQRAKQKKEKKAKKGAKPKSSSPPAPAESAGA
jgi:hypothetical protein